MTRETLTRRQVSRNRDTRDLYSETSVTNSGHASLIKVILYQALFRAIGCSINAQTLNKYSAVVVLVTTYFSTKKVMHNNEI